MAERIDASAFEDLSTLLSFKPHQTTANCVFSVDWSGRPAKRLLKATITEIHMPKRSRRVI